MHKLYRSNKKGVSAIIAYVLLILFAVGMSAGVYAWLKAKIPKAEEKCPDDVSLEITNLTIVNADLKVQMDIRNRGLFSVNGIIIRIYKDKRSCMLRLIACANCTAYTSGQNQIMFTEILKPKEIRAITVGYLSENNLCDNPTDIEIVPLRMIKLETGEEIRSLCENSILKERLI